MLNLLPERIAKRISPEPNSGCWLWTGKAGVRGYGQIRVGSGKVRQAHIVVFETLVGKVPTGLELDHKCRVHSCVNPQHLEAVTHKENMRRGLQTIQTLQSSKTECPKGHAYEGDNFRRDRRGKRICRICDRDRRRQERSDPARKEALTTRARELRREKAKDPEWRSKYNAYMRNRRRAVNSAT